MWLPTTPLAVLSQSLSSYLLFLRFFSVPIVHTCIPHTVTDTELAEKRVTGEPLKVLVHENWYFEEVAVGCCLSIIWDPGTTRESRCEGVPPAEAGIDCVVNDNNHKILFYSDVLISPSTVSSVSTRSLLSSLINFSRNLLLFRRVKLNIGTVSLEQTLS